MNDNGKITFSFRDGLNMPILELKTIGGPRNPCKLPKPRCLQNNPRKPSLADPSKWPLISIDDKQDALEKPRKLVSAEKLVLTNKLSIVSKDPIKLKNNDKKITILQKN